jgi:1-acyl-sn-glycerol-3-phosphate acyltransferase
MRDGPVEIDGTRYSDIVAKSRVPTLSLLAEAMREDRPLFLLPRAIRVTFRTALDIPRSLFMRRGAKLERYVFSVLRRWARKVCGIFQVRLSVSGAWRLDPKRTYLFAANHSSPVDIPALYAVLPVRAAFVANSLFAQIPIFSYWMRRSGAVFVDRGNGRAEMRAFRAMVRRLRRGRSLILFPEGEMHQGRGLAEFKRGGLHAAAMAGVPIVPVCLSGTADVMRPGSLRVAPRKKVVVHFGEPIELDSLRRPERKDVDSLVRSAISRMKEGGR